MGNQLCAGGAFVSRREQQLSALNLLNLASSQSSQSLPTKLESTPLEVQRDAWRAHLARATSGGAPKTSDTRGPIVCPLDIGRPVVSSCRLAHCSEQHCAGRLASSAPLPPKWRPYTMVRTSIMSNYGALFRAHTNRRPVSVQLVAAFWLLLALCSPAARLWPSCGSAWARRSLVGRFGAARGRLQTPTSPAALGELHPLRDGIWLLGAPQTVTGRRARTAARSALAASTWLHLHCTALHCCLSAAAPRPPRAARPPDEGASNLLPSKARALHFPVI